MKTLWYVSITYKREKSQRKHYRQRAVVLAESAEVARARMLAEQSRTLDSPDILTTHVQPWDDDLVGLGSTLVAVERAGKED